MHVHQGKDRGLITWRYSLKHSILTAYTHTKTHLQRPDQAEVFIKQRNVFLVFISGFGTQSGHLVTVMEQSISARLYRGGVGGCEGENGGGLTHILKREIHFITELQREGERENQRKGERRAEVEIHFITEPQSRNVSPW